LDLINFIEGLDVKILHIHRKISFIFLLFSLFFNFGCNLTPFEKGAVVVAGAAIAPSNEIEQIFYLGVFDSQSQVPQTIYRIRIHGQASMLNSMKFGSGWVKSDLIDSLTSQAEIVNQSNSLSGDNGKIFDEQLGIDSQRKLIAFGPEGFRVSPKNHRLVVVMGSSPDAFFSSVDRVLGEQSKVHNTAVSQELVRLLFDSLTSVNAQKKSLSSVKEFDSGE
jgi:hypothetical protein